MICRAVRHSTINIYSAVHHNLHIISEYDDLFTTWARFPLFSHGIKFNIPRSLSTI